MPRAGRFSGDQPQRRRVDGGIVPSGASEDGAVELGGGARTAPALMPVAGERAVLRDPGLQCSDFLVLDAPKVVLIESPCRLLGGPRAREHEHPSVLESHVGRMLLQSTLGEVECGEQLAAAFLAFDGVKPPGGGAVLRLVQEPFN